MFRSRPRFLTFVLLVAVLVLPACKEEKTAQTQDGPSLPQVKWKMANTWPTGMPILEETTLRFVERVKAMTDGHFEIRVDSSNKHKAPLGIFDMVRGGSLNLNRQPDKKVLQSIKIVFCCMTCVVSSLQIPSVMQCCVGKVHQILLPQ